MQNAAYVRVGDLLRRQDFYGYKAVETGVTGFVDHTHPALAKFLEDSVVRDGFTDHNGRGLSVAMLGVLRWQVNATGG